MKTVLDQLTQEMLAPPKPTDLDPAIAARLEHDLLAPTEPVDLDPAIAARLEQALLAPTEPADLDPATAARLEHDLFDKEFKIPTEGPSFAPAPDPYGQTPYDLPDEGGPEALPDEDFADLIAPEAANPNYEPMVATPEEVQKWTAMGKMDVGDTWDKMDIGEKIPFYGSGQELRLMWDLWSATRRLKKNKYESFDQQNEDRDLVTWYLKNMDERAVRGVTMKGKIFEGASALPKFMLEFMVTGGAASLGKKAAMKATKKALGKKVASTVGQLATKASKALGSPTGRTLAQPWLTATGAMERNLPQRAHFDDETGKFVVDKAGDSGVTSIVKSAGDVFIENLSEEAGEAIMKIMGKVVPNFVKKPWKAVANKFPKGGKVKDLFDSMGVQGYPAESAEEYYGAFLRAVTGIEGEGDIGERVGATIPGVGKSWEDVAVEQTVLAVPGAARVGGMAAGNKIEAAREKKIAKLTDEELFTLAAKKSPGPLVKKEIMRRITRERETNVPKAEEVTDDAPAQRDAQAEADRRGVIYNGPQAEADRLGITYNGPQLKADGSVAHHLFTDPKNGTSFGVKPGDSVEEKRQAAQKRMDEGASKAPGSTTVAEGEIAPVKGQEGNPAQQAPTEGQADAPDPTKVSKKEWVAGQEIPRPALSEKEMSGLAQLSDNMGLSLSLAEKKAALDSSLIDDLKRKGVTSIDAYHVTNVDPEVLKKEGILGSKLDYIGDSTGSLREKSVYLFLDPDDIKLGHDFIGSAEGGGNNVVHIKIPIEKLTHLNWDSNFNLTAGTYTSERFSGDIPGGWIQGVYKYNPKKGGFKTRQQLESEWEAAVDAENATTDAQPAPAQDPSATVAAQPEAVADETLEPGTGELVGKYQETGDETMYVLIDESYTLQSLIDDGTLTKEQAYQKLRDAGLKQEDPADVEVFGSNAEMYIEGVKRDVVKLFKGADVSTLLEEKAELWYKKKVASSPTFANQVKKWRQKYEKHTGIQDGQSDLEWFSSRATEYALHKQINRAIDTPLRQLLDRFRVYARELLQKSNALRKYLRNTKNNKRFEAALGESTSLNKLGLEAKNKPRSTEEQSSASTIRTPGASESRPISISASPQHIVLGGTDQSTTFSLRPHGKTISNRNKEFQRFYGDLSPNAKTSFDFYKSLQDIEKEAAENPVRARNSKKIWKKYKNGDILNRFLTTAQLNEFVKKNPHAQAATQQIYELLDPKVREEMGLREDGLFDPGILDDIGFKVKRSIMQRVLDARNNVMTVTLDSPLYTLPGTDITVDLGQEGTIPFDEDYRQALLKEMRRMYKEGTLDTASPGAMSVDTWGTMGFLSANQKTIASSDTTTLCPQIMYNGGCFYCYRRAALASDINTKLGGEKVWYGGELLRMRPDDVNDLNAIGGLRHQSFGDWYGTDAQTLRMFVDMLYDAELQQLQSKVITKDGGMVEFVASIMDQKITHEVKGKQVSLGSYVFFNLSTDYLMEEAGPAEQADEGGVAPLNAERPFKRFEEHLEPGQMGPGRSVAYWKRALSVEEADELAKKYHWVNVRTVATDAEEFIEGLLDPRVHVVTGYHGKIREHQRGVTLHDGTRLKFDLESIGDDGMPTFNSDGSIKSHGKNRQHFKLAYLIHKFGLQDEYYRKACCITGRCKSCTTKCGAAQRHKYTSGRSFPPSELLSQDNSTIRKVAEAYDIDTDWKNKRVKNKDIVAKLDGMLRVTPSFQMRVKASGSKQTRPAPPPKVRVDRTSARQEHTDADREPMGLDVLPSPSRVEWQQNLDEAKEQRVPEKALRIAGEIQAAPRALSATETAGLVIRAVELKAEHRGLVNEMRDLDDKADLRAKAEEIRRVQEEFDLITDGLRKSGTEKGRALAAQKLTINQDFDLITVTNRAKAARGKALSVGIDKRFAMLTEALEDAVARVGTLKKDIASRDAVRAIETAGARKYSRMSTREKDADLESTASRLRELMSAQCYDVN